MSYVESNLMRDEQVVYVARVHWSVFIPGWVLMALAVLSVVAGGADNPMFAVFLWTSIGYFVRAHLIRKHTELAVTSKRRSPIFPNVPTVSETHPGFDAVTWFGILAPAKTPAPIVAKLNAEINKALQDPNVRKSIEKEGGEVLGGTAQQFADLMKSDMAAWAAVVKSSGAKVD